MMTNRSMKNSAGIATVQNFSMPPCMPPMTITTLQTMNSTWKKTMPL